MEVQIKAESQPVKHLPPSVARRKKHRHGNVRRGRYMLLAIFIVLHGSQILLYLGAPRGYNSEVMGSLITSGIWTTALLIAIACRKNWARYILSGLLIFAVIATIWMMSISLQENSMNSFVTVTLITSLVVNGGAFWCLIYSSSIRRLTDRH